MGSNRNGKNFVVQTRFDGSRREFFQHDDRGQSSYTGGNRNSGRQKFSGRGGNYYQNSSGGNRYQRGNRRGQGNYRASGHRKFPQDEIPMGEGKGNRHQQFYEQSRGRKPRPYNNRGRQFSSGFMGWHKVVIKETASYPKEEVLSSIRELVSDNFIPVLFGIEGNNHYFFLENNPGVAKAILNLSGRLTMGQNHKIHISLMDNAPPYRKLIPPQIEIIKTVINDRYSAELNRLDLSNFHNDKTLINNQIYCPLHRHAYNLVVLEIFLANYPNVEEIDLSRNFINVMHSMEGLKKCVNLKRLSLEKNSLRTLDALVKLKGLGIVELNLEGNSLCDRFEDAEIYTSAVRDIFPKVHRLDGVELPKPIGFEVEDEVNLPPTQSSFFCSDDIKGIVVTFIEQYYQVFESDNRKPLEAAYTEDAHFSLSSNFPENGVGSKYTTVFERDSRNLKKVTNPDKRISLLCKGRSQVSDMLCRFPKCLHDPNSFVIDIPIAKPCLMHVVLTGVFKQIVDKNPPIRSFMKSMVIVPVGSGFCISNEELYINNATGEQFKKAFSGPTQQPSSSVPVSPVQPNVVSSPVAELSPAHIQLIKEFAKHSKMLPEYCKMCLEKNNWDFAKAGEMFTNLFKENKIPPEYFDLPTGMDF